VQRACEILGSPAPVARLSAEADAYDQRVSNFVADDGDLIGYVSRLESMTDDDDDGGIFDYEDDDDDDVVGGELGDDLADEELDSEELMAEVERFLRDQGPDES
jgi:hypothetical protein